MSERGEKRFHGMQIAIDANAVANANVRRGRRRGRVRALFTDHFGEHGDDAIEQRTELVVDVALQEAERFENVDDGGAFQRGTASNGIESTGVLVELPAALGDVERDRCRRSAELVAKRSVASRRVLRQGRDMGKQFDGTTIDVELLESEHTTMLAVSHQTVAPCPNIEQDRRRKGEVERVRVCDHV